MMYLYVANPKSKGAAALAKGLGIQRIRHNGSQFRGDESKTVINWGAIKVPGEVMYCNVLNKPYDVARSSDKLSFFRRMQGFVRIPAWTDGMDVAKQWIAEGYSVMERHVLRGSGGAGCRMVVNEASLREAPLYTRYQKKKEEYRIHLHRFKGVFDAQRKARRKDCDYPNWSIRNKKGGFIYAREDLDVPDDVYVQAIKCLDRSGLDFGAVDVIWNDDKKEAYVLEINTAPGLEGTTLKNYLKIFCND